MHNKWFIGLFTLSFLIIQPTAKGQTYAQQNRQLLVYNVGINALIGGLGGVINKKPEEKWHQAFLKNSGFGALGGLIKHHSKYLTYHTTGVDKPYVLNYVNRLYYFAGHSLVNNATCNQHPLSRYSFQLYLLNLDIHLKEQIKWEPRISFSSFYFTNLYVFTGHKINLKQSLRYGVIFYDSGPFLNPSQMAWAAANTIAAMKGFENFYSNPSLVIAHEMVHTYQNTDYFPITYFFNPLHAKIKNNKWVKIADKIFYWDLPITYTVYNILNKIQPPPVHYNNFFEYEAQSYATRQVVFR